MNKNLLIAIDGPSSSGKGTVAKKVANHFNLPCLNTGGLYRAIAFLALENNLNVSNSNYLSYSVFGIAFLSKLSKRASIGMVNTD